MVECESAGKHTEEEIDEESEQEYKGRRRREEAKKEVVDAKNKAYRRKGNDRRGERTRWQ